MSISLPPPRAKMKRKILDHMRDHYQAHGAFPTRRQIAAALERKPNGYISRVVDQLREKGHLRAIERARR